MMRFVSLQRHVLPQEWFVDWSQHLNLSEGTLTTFLCRLLEVYL